VAATGGLGRPAMARPHGAGSGYGNGMGSGSMAPANGSAGQAAAAATLTGYREPTVAQAQSPRADTIERAYAEATPFPRPPQRPLARTELTDLDIPTFIRRQMD
jgi:hypothetical protein